MPLDCLPRPAAWLDFWVLGMLLARDEALPQKKRLAQKLATLPPCVSLFLMILVPQPILGSLFLPLTTTRNKIIFCLGLCLLSDPLFVLERMSVILFHSPTLSPSCLFPTPREGADIGLQDVKSTSAAFLWSLVIHRARWGESTGKKEGGGKATRDTLYNSKEQRRL